MRRGPFVHADLAFDNVDDLVPAKNPGERAGGAIPESRGEQAVG